MGNLNLNIGHHTVGNGHPVFIIAEIGINHNGNLTTAMELIEAAAVAGANAVKVQKRRVDVVYTESQLSEPRQSEFGSTNGDLKRGLEFDMETWRRLDRFASGLGLPLFASCWDPGSVDDFEELNPLLHKVASPCLTDEALLIRLRSTGRPLLLSTGMSTQDQIDRAMNILSNVPVLLLHCTSAYPPPPSELNLRCITTLRERYGVPVGYSGHELDSHPTLAAVALGACVIERHLTLCRTSVGSDQHFSLEPDQFHEMVRSIRNLELSLGEGTLGMRPSEMPAMEKLRRFHW